MSGFTAGTVLHGKMPDTTNLQQRAAYCHFTGLSHGQQGKVTCDALHLGKDAPFHYFRYVAVGAIKNSRLSSAIKILRSQTSSHLSLADPPEEMRLSPIA